jgi:hypothetical protein
MGKVTQELSRRRASLFLLMMRYWLPLFVYDDKEDNIVD